MFFQSHAQLLDLEADLAAKEAAQAGKAPTEEPAFYSSDVSIAYQALDKAFAKLNAKRAPKPPPEPKAAPKPDGALGAGGPRGSGLSSRLLACCVGVGVGQKADMQEKLCFGSSSLTSCVSCSAVRRCRRR